MAKNAVDFLKDLSNDGDLRNRLAAMPLSEAAALVEAKGYSMTAEELAKILKDSLKAISDSDLFMAAGMK